MPIPSNAQIFNSLYGSLDPKDAASTYGIDPAQLQKWIDQANTPELKEDYAATHALVPPALAEWGNAWKQDFNDILRGIPTVGKLAIEGFSQDIQAAGRAYGDPNRIGPLDVAAGVGTRLGKMAAGTPAVLGEIGTGMYQSFRHPITGLKEHPLMTVLDWSMFLDLMGGAAGRVAKVAGKAVPERAAFIPRTARGIGEAGEEIIDIARIKPREYSKNYYRRLKQYAGDQATEKIPFVNDAVNQMYGAMESVKLFQKARREGDPVLKKIAIETASAKKGVTDDMWDAMRLEFELPDAKATEIAAMKSAWAPEKLALYEERAPVLRDLQIQTGERMIQLGLLDEMAIAKATHRAEMEARSILKPGEDFTDDLLYQHLDTLPNVQRETRTVQKGIKKARDVVDEGRIVEDAAGKTYETHGVYTAKPEAFRYGGIDFYPELTEQLPQGTYFTPPGGLSYETGGAGLKWHELKKTEVELSKERIVKIKDEGNYFMSANEAFAHKIMGAKKFNQAIKEPEKFIALLKTEYPQYADAFDQKGILGAMQMYGSILAREKGYNGILLVSDKFPNGIEFVALNKNAIKVAKKLSFEALELGQKLTKKWVLLKDTETGQFLDPMRVSELRKNYVLQNKVSWYNKQYGPVWFHHEAARDIRNLREQAAVVIGKIAGIPGGGVASALRSRKYATWDEFADAVRKQPYEGRGVLKPVRSIGDAQLSALNGLNNHVAKLRIIQDTVDRFAKPIVGDALDRGFVALDVAGSLKQAAANVKAGRMVSDALKGVKTPEGAIKALGDGIEKLVNESLEIGATDIWKDLFPQHAQKGMMQIPASVAAELKHAVGINQIGRSSIGYINDSIVHAIRTSQLTLSPRWVINNAIGNAVLSALSGVGGGVRAIIPQVKIKGLTVFPGAKRNRQITALLKEDARLKELGERGLFPDDVLNHNLINAELGEGGIRALMESGTTDLANEIAKKIPLVGAPGLRAVRAFANAVQQTNAYIERYARANVYLSRVRDQAARGNIVNMAKRWANVQTTGDMIETLARTMKDPKLVEKFTDYVNKTLFDYSAMTAFGRNVMRRAFMYWSWQKSITKRFWRLPLDEPTKTAVLASLAIQAADAVRNDDMPEWLMATAILFTDPEKGVSELAPLRAKNPFEAAIVPTKEGVERAMAGMNPILKTFLEFGSGYSFFKGKKYEDMTGEARPSFPELAARNFPQYELLTTLASGSARTYDAVGLGQIMAAQFQAASGNPDAMNWIAVRDKQGAIIEKPIGKKLLALMTAVSLFSYPLEEAKAKTVRARNAKASRIFNRLMTDAAAYDRFVEWFALLLYDPEQEYDRAINEITAKWETGTMTVKDLRREQNEALKRYQTQDFLRQIGRPQETKPDRAISY